MYNTIEEANAAAEALNATLDHLHAATIQVYKFNFEPKYKVAYIPIEYKEQYNNAAHNIQCLFHYATFLGIGVLINEGVQSIYVSSQIKGKFDTLVGNDEILKDLKTYLDL